MVDPTRKNRLSPPLMHVFRAAHAARDARAVNKGRLNEARSRMSQRVAITERDLRREVARDLEMLMNCIAMESTVDLGDFPAVRRSILNYGFPDIANRTIAELSAQDLDVEIERVLRLFEPRLVRSSLRVSRDKTIAAEELKIRYLVHSDLNCEPLHVPLQFVADVDLTTGKIQIDRL